MTFTLSVEGVDYWRQIISTLYSYIGMLRHYEGHLPEWIYLELKSLHDFAHRFADEPSPDDLVENIVEDMAPHLNLPPERLLDGGDLLFEYNPEEIQVRLSHVVMLFFCFCFCHVFTNILLLLGPVTFFQSTKCEN